MRRLKFLRIESGLTLAQVAARSGINRSIICNVENGRINPRQDEREALATVFRCDPDRLLDPISAAGLPDGAESRDGQRNRRETRR